VLLLPLLLPLLTHIALAADVVAAAAAPAAAAELIQLWLIASPAVGSRVGFPIAFHLIDVCFWAWKARRWAKRVAENKCCSSDWTWVGHVCGAPLQI